MAHPPEARWEKISGEKRIPTLSRIGDPNSGLKGDKGEDSRGTYFRISEWFAYKFKQRGPEPKDAEREKAMLV